MSAAAGHPSAAITRCREVLEHHAKSFALASKFLPAACRDDAAVVYAYCRFVDDAIDSVRDGRSALVRLREELDEVYGSETPHDPVLAAFQDVVRRTGIPRAYPAELLAGMEMDVEGFHYETVDELLLYAFRVAGTVGLMMSHVMGVARDEALVNAARLGIAMQLTNIARDVLEDWSIGRLYLPFELFDLKSRRALAEAMGEEFPRGLAPAVRTAVDEVLAIADRYYRSGEEGLSALSFRCALAIRTASLVYSAIGHRISRRGHDPLHGRAVVPSREKLVLVGESLRRSLLELPARLRAASMHTFGAPGRELTFTDALLVS